MSLDLEKEGISVIQRSEWASTEPRPWLMRDVGGYDRITIHHTGSEMPIFVTKREKVIDAINNVLKDHLDRQYGDIAYHFLIDYAGRVWAGRSLAYEGAHVQDQNENNLGIVLLGNFDEQEPSGEQINSLFRLIQGVRRTFGIKLHRVYGHRDLGYSVCPGKHLYSHVQQLKS